MLTRVPYVANGQGGTDEGSIGGIDETIDSMTNAAEISVGVCWAGGEILSLTSRLNESYKTLQLRGTEGPNCKPVSGHSVSLHLGTHLSVAQKSNTLGHNRQVCMLPRTDPLAQIQTGRTANWQAAT